MCLRWRHGWDSFDRSYLMWAIKCSLRVNGLLQTVQTCGLSPEWCFKWLVRCSRLVNTLLQNSHLCGDMPVWIISWLFKCSRLMRWNKRILEPVIQLDAIEDENYLVNILLQNWQRCGESPVCLRTWFVRCSWKFSNGKLENISIIAVYNRQFAHTFRVNVFGQ